MQLQNTFDKNKIEADLKKKEEEQKSTKSIILGALRKISGGSRKNSKVILIHSDTKYFIDIPKKRNRNWSHQQKRRLQVVLVHMWFGKD